MSVSPDAMRETGGPVAERPGHAGASARSRLWLLDSRARAVSLPVAFTVAATLTWLVGVLVVALDRHATIRSHRFDLGNMVQAVWSTAAGRPLEVTVATGEQMSRLGVHVDPILAALAPLWLLFPTPVLLLVVQAVALAAGVVPVVALARRHTGSEWAAASFALVYLVQLTVVWNAIGDFHPITLSLPLLLAAVAFLDRDSLAPFAVVAGVALLTGELVGLTVGALGVWYALAHGRRGVGAVIAAAGWTWTIVCLKLIVPAFSNGGDSVFYGRFENVGGSPGGLVATTVRDPLAVVQEMTTLRDVRYLAILLVPLLGLWLWSSLTLVALPHLSILLLAGFSSSTLPQYQYGAPVVAIVLAASIMGASRAAPRSRPLVALAALASGALLLAAIPPRPGVEPYLYAAADEPAHRRHLEQALAFVPADAPVSTTNRLGGQVSDRRYVYSFPERAAAEWVVVDRRDPWLAVSGEGDDPRRFRSELAALKRDPRFTLTASLGDVQVYRRVSSEAP